MRPDSLLLGLPSVVAVAALVGLHEVPTDPTGALLFVLAVMTTGVGAGRFLGWLFDRFGKLPSRFRVRRIRTWEHALGVLGGLVFTFLSLIALTLTLVGVS